MQSELVDSAFADAYAFFDQGLCYDEAGQTENAKQMYEKGIAIVDEATKVHKSEKSPLYENIVETKKKVEQRLNDIKSGKTSKNEKAVVEALRQEIAHSAADDADLLYWLPEGVQLVVIENGTTAAPTTPSSLIILRLTKEAIEKMPSVENREKPKALIQVGPWAYPLIPGQTTVLKNELGVYVLPNPTPEHPEMFVGIILPQDIEKRLEDEFLLVLREYAVVHTSTLVREMSAEEKSRTSDRLAAFLIKGGDRVAQEVQNLANRTGGYLADRGERYRSTLTPTEEAMNISPTIRHGVYFMHHGGKSVAKVTKYLLNKIGDVGVSVGRQLAGGIGGESGGGRFLKSTVTVVGGGITGASTVWMSLETASRTLFNSMANETVQTVRIKYGDQASETTHHALHAVGHTTLAGFQLWDLGPRSIAGRMARKAGLQFVNEVGSGKRQSTSGETAVSSSTKFDAIDEKKHK